MAFWDGLVKGIQNFFGGGDNQKKKKDEEEQRRQRATSSSAPKLNVQNNNQQGSNSNQLKVQQPKPMFGTLNNSSVQDPLKLKTPTVKPIQPVQKTKQQELDELANKNYDSSLGLVNALPEVLSETVTPESIAILIPSAMVLALITSILTLFSSTTLINLKAPIKVRARRIATDISISIKVKPFLLRIFPILYLIIPLNMPEATLT